MLNTLAMTLEKRGPEYVNQFLSEDVIITEKLDTYRILFENINGELKFFKKDNTELNLIERVLTNIWEDAIIELSIILDGINLPSDIRFGLAYTPVNKPIRLVYENLPKYILTDVTKRDPFTKKVTESYDLNEVNEWAAKLNLARPPVIFEGKLSKNQIEKLIEYGSSSLDEEISLTSIIGKSYSNAPISEGIIVKNDSQLIQIESYEFEILREAYEKVENSRDFYDLTLLQMNSFMDNYRFPVLKEEKSDNLYLELICDMFNSYCENGNISEDLDPSYLTPPTYGYSGDLNLLLINNKNTIKILEKGSKIHESIFKIMLSSFRKYKKPFGLLRESDVQKLNTYIFFINERTKGEDIGKVPSSEIISEIEKVIHSNFLNESRSDNIVVGEVERKIRSDVDNMKVISSIQKAFKPISQEFKKGEERCVVYVTDPAPLTVEQEDNIKNLYRLWKCPIILAFVKNENKEKGQKFQFSDNLKKAQIEMFADNNISIVPAFLALNSWDLIEIFNFCRPKYEPVAVITDESKKSEFVLQLFFEEEIMGKRIGVQRDFNIGEVGNTDQLHAYRSIEDNLFNVFKELTPQPIWGLYNSMISEYKEWNGSVPRQFEDNKFE